MNMEILISTINQEGHDILKRMNIQSDAIVINQCNINSFEEFKYEDNNIKFYSFSERGVGLSRNTALMRAKADICLIADDDIVYVDDYTNIVLQAFKECTQADVIIFNIKSKDGVRNRYRNLEYKRLRITNIFRYGAARIAVKTDSVKKSNIFFSLLFGGGAPYSSGEDSLFLFECIRKGLKIYSCPYEIGESDDSSSTWFSGYTNKYFLDKGAFYFSVSKRFARILCLFDAFRHRDLYRKEKYWFDAYKMMSIGIKDFNEN